LCKSANVDFLRGKIFNVVLQSLKIILATFPMLFSLFHHNHSKVFGAKYSAQHFSQLTNQSRSQRRVRLASNLSEIL
jgi:hypothetical protein